MTGIHSRYLKVSIFLQALLFRIVILQPSWLSLHSDYL
jgi:hypothetical protein